MIEKEKYEEIQKAWPVQHRDGKLLKNYQHWDRSSKKMEVFALNWLISGIVGWMIGMIVGGGYLAFSWHRWKQHLNTLLH